MKDSARGQTHQGDHAATLAGGAGAVLRVMKRRWHYVYLALARDGSYYCGYALDPHARIAAHNRGAGAKALRGRKPVRLAYTRRFPHKSDALRFELQLKRRTHAYKATLSRRWRRARRD